MFGQLSYDVEVDVPAADAWELYSTLQLAKVVQEGLSSMLRNVEVVEGDGGVGTVLQLTLAPSPGTGTYIPTRPPACFYLCFFFY